MQTTKPYILRKRTRLERLPYLPNFIKKTWAFTKGSSLRTRISFLLSSIIIVMKTLLILFIVSCKPNTTKVEEKKALQKSVVEEITMDDALLSIEELAGKAGVTRYLTEQLVNNPSGSQEDLQVMETYANDTQTSLTQIYENIKALKGVLPNVYNGNITNDLKTISGGFAIGNGCNNKDYLIATYEGNYDFKNDTIEVFDKFVVTGKLFNNGVYVTKQTALERGLLVKRCEKAEIEVNEF